MKYILYICLSFLVFTSCKKDSESTNSYGSISDYYPLKVGSYHIYLVDSTYYNDVTKKSEDYQFQTKEVITETYYDDYNQLNYKIEKYVRYKTDSTTYDEEKWVIKDVWHVIKKTNSIERVEENIRTINLVNPIVNNKTWNGNAYNYKGAWDFTYDGFEDENQDSLKVIQTNTENAIQKQYYEQNFVKNIGIVKFHYIDVESQNTSSTLPIMQKIEKGVIYTQTLVDYYIP